MINVQNLLPVWILCGWCGAKDQACIRAIRKLVAQHGPRDTVRARLPDKMVGIDTTKPWTHNTSWYRHAIQLDTASCTPRFILSSLHFGHV